MPKYGEIDWDQAACKGSELTDLFYSVEEARNLVQYEYINALRSICMTCPIWKDCLSYGFQYEDYGVWGGLTTQERQGMRDPKMYGNQIRRALFAFEEYGISYEMVAECIRPRTPLLDR
jgi:hypothetical protein